MLRTLRGVAAGMEWLHAQNVLHGDLKAGNVMLQYRPRSGQSGASPGAVRSGEALVSELMEEGPGALAAAVASGAVDIVPKVADFGLSRSAWQEGRGAVAARGEAAPLPVRAQGASSPRTTWVAHPSCTCLRTLLLRLHDMHSHFHAHA
jgi:serine/threonine protein kinase